MGIAIYNTLGRKKEPFVPMIPGKVGMYVCGVTVYDYSHIGHARVMVVFDVIARHFRVKGFDLTYVRNFTDIDDKIIKRANERGESIQELTSRYIDAFHDDMGALGVQKADIEPKATEHLPEMQQMITALVDKGVAYPSGGDVYYAVDQFKNYGQLSGKVLDEQEAGARVDVDHNKRNPMDFVLWKGAKPEEPQWDSPWGSGRPGWHIECSAMGTKYLGDSFDIHGGGRDLIFPHHENEIAQTEGCTGKHAVNYWIHNGFVNVINEEGEAEKMSKSLGNFHTIRDLLERYHGEVLRFFILNSHYRSPLDFNFGLLDAAKAGLDRLYTALRAAQGILGRLPSDAIFEMSDVPEGAPQALVERYLKSMDDDFNTPQAIAQLFEAAKMLNTAIAEKKDPEVIATWARVIRGLGQHLGLAEQNPESWFRAERTEEGGLGAEAIEALITQRTEARQSKNWAESDRIRDELAAQGIVLEDGAQGTQWSRK
ncbi:cysteine--tRNA ligase [Magnetococcus sp. PR-3]|uniref:cysteine--tRNA ligase n=1 Tax=Magnetococcus sp. PR-3 TaxID=3120355 RepID=UPI002FCE5080